MVTSTVRLFTAAADAVSPLLKVNCAAAFVMLAGEIALLKTTLTTALDGVVALTTFGAGQISTTMSEPVHAMSCALALYRQSGVPGSVTTHPAMRSWDAASAVCSEPGMRRRRSALPAIPAVSMVVCTNDVPDAEKIELMVAEAVSTSAS